MGSPYIVPPIIRGLTSSTATTTSSNATLVYSNPAPVTVTATQPNVLVTANVVAYQPGSTGSMFGTIGRSTFGTTGAYTNISNNTALSTSTNLSSITAGILGGAVLSSNGFPTTMTMSVVDQPGAGTYYYSLWTAASSGATSLRITGQSLNMINSG